MPILTIILVLFIVGVVLYFLESVKTMDSTIRWIIRIFIIIVTIIWLLKVMGVWGTISNVRV